MTKKRTFKDSKKYFDFINKYRDKINVKSVSVKESTIKVVYIDKKQK